MPRNLSIAAKAYTGPIAWLADITPRRTTAVYHFADQQGVFAGQSYEPLLRVAQGPRFSRTLAADYGEIELVANPNLIAQAPMPPIGAPPVPFERFEGALCVLSQHLIGLDESIVLLRGRLTELEESDAGFRFRIVSELDPAQIQVHARSYASLCTWPFRRGLCGYLDSGFSEAEHLAERTATAAALFSLTDSSLALTVDEHKDRYVLLTAGTGRGQLRRIRSNTATSLTVWSPFSPVPDTSTKFKVFSFIGGASKPLWTSAGSARLQSASPTTGGTTRTLSDTSLSMITDEHKGDLVWWKAEGKVRRIKSNTATVITFEDDEPDIALSISPLDEFAVRFRRCPKDFLACELRARTEAHNGFPTLVPLVSQAAGEPPVIPPGVAPPGGGGWGGGSGGGGGIPL
ncbi:MAG: hypothetical protein ACRD5I_04115 [Candidatus Acidiferrales bacterium]